MQRITIIIFLLCLWAGSSQALIITVDSLDSAGFNTIQMAVDTAQDGDIVLVPDGTYTGEGNVDINLGGKAITLRSINGPFRCIIDCQGDFLNPHRAFVAASQEQSDTVIAGFTIRNGFVVRSHQEMDLAGGAILCLSSSPTIMNCVFENNVANYGGAVAAIGRTLSANPTLTNCTFWGNNAQTQGGAVYAYLDAYPWIASCIMGANFSRIGPQLAIDISAGMGVEYSNVEGGHTEVAGANLNWGSGNIDVDPCFVQAGESDRTGLWLAGDYHLMSQFGRWEYRGRTWTMDTNTSPCVDTGRPGPEWAAEVWANGVQVNMGAYGGTAETSRSLDVLATLPDDDTTVQAYRRLRCDLNGDWRVDYRDLKTFCQHWLSIQRPVAADFYQDGQVEGRDLSLLLGSWLKNPIENKEPLPINTLWDQVPFTSEAMTVLMSAQPAFSTDGSGVEYYFRDSSHGHINSGWLSFGVGQPVFWEDTEVSPGGVYQYIVKARNKGNKVETGWSTAENVKVGEIPDTDPPSPNPARWLKVPNWLNDTTISMEASPATDISGVEYRFICTTHLNEPSLNSDWQDSPIFQSTPTVTAAMFTFQVSARDKSPNHNTTMPSDAESVFSDITAPSPNPMEWAEGGEPILFMATTSNISWTFRMTAAEATDDSGGDVEYLFECLDDSRYSSSWTKERTFEKLVGTKQYWWRFRVWARDANFNTTAPSPDTTVIVVN